MMICCPTCGQFHDRQSEPSAEDGGPLDMPRATLPWYGHSDIADYLVEGTWSAMSFGVPPGGTITVDITGLTADGQQFANWALEAWTYATGLAFQQVSGSSADIVFDDTNSGAYANMSSLGGTISWSTINVSVPWLSYGTDPMTGALIQNSYTTQTFIHEIGHALGLGHAGAYNGSASYDAAGGGDNHYLNDSWQASVMSYFDQSEATAVTADYAYIMTPMIADIVAIRTLYGSTGTLRTGDDTYGKTWVENIFSDHGFDYGSTQFAATIVDDGGIDRLDVTWSTADQVIDLTEGAYSDIDGAVGALGIAIGSVIEEAFTGIGADAITGNAAANDLRAGAGNDTLDGGAGNDILRGEDGEDVLSGGSGDDTLYGGNGSDTMDGAAGNDTMNGQSGNDDLSGMIGDDWLFGAAGLDTLGGGDGHDMLSGGGDADSLTGGIGNDTLFGGGGDDFAIWGDAGDDVISGGSGHDTVLSGGDGADLVLGAAGNDDLSGDTGADTLSGGFGNDTVDGGDDADALYGAGDDDTVSGGTGNDTISGGAGNDVLSGDAGNDWIIGALGDDTIDGGTGDDFLAGGGGADVFTFTTGSGADTVAGFTLGVDVLQFDDALWTGTLTAQDVIDTYATQLSPGIVAFAFVGGESVQLVNGAGIDITELAGDILIV